MKMCWDDQLTDKEIFFLGKIVAHWGAIEYEVFAQTLHTFEGSADTPSELPKAMKNLSFVSVLDLWEERVIRKTPGERGEALRGQLEEIKDAKEFRHMLVHSMLHWSSSDISRIIASRVKNRDYIEVDISRDDLMNFYTRLAQINFNLRSPGGLEELAEKRMDSGEGFSRQALAMISGHDLLSDWVSPSSKSDSSGE